MVNVSCYCPYSPSFRRKLDLEMSKHSFLERFSATGLKIASSNGYILKCVGVNEKYSCCFSGLASETQ